MISKRLQQNFFKQDTHVVAKKLLGKVLVRQDKEHILSGRITEVESYIGQNDKASHASRGLTPRTKPMFGHPGKAYIYLIYGMYNCLNIVTGENGFPAAVLIRALEPLEGLESMLQKRQTKKIANLTTGPGKLTQALDISRDLNEEDLTISARLYIIDDGFGVSKKDIATSPRIGVTYAGESALLPWRYYLEHSAFVSRYSK